MNEKKTVYNYIFTLFHTPSFNNCGHEVKYKCDGSFMALLLSKADCSSKEGPFIIIPIQNKHQ